MRPIIATSSVAMAKRQNAISTEVKGLDQRTKIGLVEKKKTAIQTYNRPIFDCLTIRVDDDVAVSSFCSIMLTAAAHFIPAGSLPGVSVSAPGQWLQLGRVPVHLRVAKR